MSLANGFFRLLTISGSILCLTGGFVYGAQADPTTTTTTSDDDEDTPKPEKKQSVQTYGKSESKTTTKTAPAAAVAAPSDDDTSAQAVAATATKSATTTTATLTEKPFNEKVRPNVTRGFDYLNKKKYPESIRELSEALRIDKDCLMARRYLVAALLGNNLAAQALDQSIIISKTAKPTAMDKFYLGQSYFALKEFDPAAQAFKEALKLDPNAENARAQLVRALAYEGKFTEAFQYCQQGMDLNRKVPKMDLFYKELMKEIAELKTSDNPGRFRSSTGTSAGPTGPSSGTIMTDPAEKGAPNGGG